MKFEGRRYFVMAALLGCLLAAPLGPIAAQTAAPAAKAKAPSGDGDLRRRVDQLEEQLVDLQVVIGTLESLARSGGGGTVAPRVAAPAGLSSADSARIEGLEMQIQALTSQIQQLQAGGGASSGGGASFNVPPATSQFGSTTVNSATGDPIGGLIGESSSSSFSASPLPPVGTGNAPAAPAPGAVAAIDPAASGGDPKQSYEQAYGYLLQQNYGAAQAGFTDFLKTYPRDSLVPNALYWLGETHYVQRNYADAAEAFDLVMQGYGNSPKAPDSMLKRGMSLAALGKKPDACDLLGQLPGKYPSAPAHLKSKAASERQRIGCP